MQNRSRACSLRKVISGMLLWVCLVGFLFSVVTIEASAAVKVPKVTNVAAFSKTYDSLKITWKQVPKATGYQIYRATSKTGNYKAVKKTGQLYFVDKELQSKKTYYYKVRAYRKVNGKTYYGSMSSIVYAKTKSIYSISKSSMTVDGKCKLKVTYYGLGVIDYQILDETEYVDCKWDEWYINGNTRYFYITPLKKGTCQLRFTNDETKEVYNVKLKVEEPIKITKPQLPVTLSNVNSAVSVDQITYTSGEPDQYYDEDEYYFDVKISISGIKTNSLDESYENKSFYIHWKLYDEENNVIDNGDVSTPPLAVGDRFKNCEFVIRDLVIGRYTLQLY